MFRNTVQHFYIKIRPHKLDDFLEEKKLSINSHAEKDSRNWRFIRNKGTYQSRQSQRDKMRETQTLKCIVTMVITSTLCLAGL